ncbi:hypothetical protein NQ318_015108 [Aromia moschata]|uniref:Rab-GAP TBC domain-containing protein n=1 Tax=Aromia moschata TaxID=1265417 RepID=A0AAV8YXK5_9CUCU|nr:hypothetical protein NQ318_015108 [Aromia moschata]
MKEQNHATPTRSISSAANLTSLCVDISPSSSNFFEVLYIGKIKVWQKKVPETFIDDALEKFRAHELEKHKLRQIGPVGRLQNEDSIVRRGSADSTASEDSFSTSAPSVLHVPPPLLRSQSAHSSLLVKPAEKTFPDDGDAETQSASGDDRPKASVDMDDHNRTMVLQVDRTDLRLISPDRKVILLHKHHKDVTTCVQGLVRAEHFGFVCREGGNTQTYIAFIFKCESPSIASDACAAITQAFLSAESRPRPSTTSCEHCPMVWYHKLCVEIEHMSDRKTQAAILRRTAGRRRTIHHTHEVQGERRLTQSGEQNEFLMMLLRAHCEMKQGRHVHDTAENRSEFLNQYLGSSTIFTKAKRSLTNSFDQLLKRKGSRDDFGASLKTMNLPITNNLNRESSPAATSVANDISDRDSEPRSRSSTIGSQSDLKDHLSIRENGHKCSVSPGSERWVREGSQVAHDGHILEGGQQPQDRLGRRQPQQDGRGSWRQAIFKRVITPSKPDNVEEPSRQRTREELRILWKKSIYQAILLVRMEKENARIKAKQEESAVKRIKLEYDEMKPNQREVMDVWEMVTTKEGGRMRCDNQMLMHAIRQGVPRGKRGEVWQFLAEQYCAKIPPIDLAKYPNYNIPYDTLLKQLTSHQHAILIDLGKRNEKCPSTLINIPNTGRTFPNHSYFSSHLGPGQLALFNLLKAYSLLDQEVGYCQGLSFVAGVLLLHMEEHQAFFLLRHLMYRRGLRKQYLPDMVVLQIKLYQLSRLVHDQLPELYNHFDFYEVAPTLYAAPWLLTIFASQFPLGFVTRVFDLMFLEGPDVVFRVALALLSFHKEKLLICDSFEEIMNYLKIQVPNIDKPTLDKIMKQVYTTDLSKQLNEYKVEYQVLQEEMQSVQPQVEALHKLEAQNKTLTEQNKALMGQLEMALANVQRLEKTRVLQQSQLNRLEMQFRAQEVTIATLGNFINNLVEQKVEVEIPDEVRRILTQISFTEKRKNEFKPQQNNLMKMFQKAGEPHPDRLMVKSMSTGKIAVPTAPDQHTFRAHSLNVQDAELKTLAGESKSQSNSAEKISKFFSSSHNTILHQKLMPQSVSNPKIDIRIQDFESDQTSKRVAEKTDLPLSEYDGSKVSPTGSMDSGVGTPVSPKAADPHPLSNCDVTFTYNGTRELKNIKALKGLSRNSSPDLIK